MTLENLKEIENIFFDWNAKIRLKMSRDFLNRFEGDGCSYADSDFVPEEMISFYEKQEKDLTEIQNQLNAEILSKINNAYKQNTPQDSVALVLFDDLVKDLNTSILYAKETNRLLALLRRFTGEYENHEYEKSNEIVKKLMIALV